MDAALVGKSPAFQKTLQLARRAADSAFPVHICGATGTGKELVARLIHHRSRVGRGPFVALNCGALPRDLLEAELFGVEGGVPGMSFRQPSPGKFTLADGGTLFLDEIGELSPEAQAKLLRVVETGRFFPVCGKSERRAQARLVCAGQQPLLRLVGEGRLRADLYYRLAVLEIVLPTLSERAADIALLAEHFRSRYCPDRRLSREAMDYLRRRSYPGNVRELEMLVKRASAWCDGEEILPEHFRDTAGAPLADGANAADAVLRLFSDHETVSPREIRRRLGFPQSRARSALDELLRQGRVQRVGRGRSTAYMRLRG